MEANTATERSNTPRKSSTRSRNARERTDTAKRTAADPSLTEPVRPSREEIATLAYLYWEARNGDDGSAEEDWLRAERALIEAVVKQRIA